MKKALFLLMGVISGVHLYGYEVEIENDTDGRITAVVHCKRKGRAKRRVLRLDAGQERKVRNVDEVTSVNVTSADGQNVVYKPKGRKKNIDLEVDIEDGKLVVEEEWF